MKYFCLSQFSQGVISGCSHTLPLSSRINPTSRAFVQSENIKVSESKSLHQNDIGLADFQEGDDINIDMRHGEDEDDDDL